MKKILFGLIIIFVLVLSSIFINAQRTFSNPHLEGKLAPSPVITLNGHPLNNKYESFCWNEDCSQKTHHQPSLVPTDVKNGDIIEIDWQTFKDKPNRVILHNISTGETIVYHLNDSDIELDISKLVTNPVAYEVIFQWYLGATNDLRGESYLTFSVTNK